MESNWHNAIRLLGLKKMTFKCHTTNQDGNPVAGVLISANILDTGKLYQRSSDGSGYSDLNVGSDREAKSALISVIKEGYQVYTEYRDVTAGDQEVSITLLPFVEL